MLFSRSPLLRALFVVVAFALLGAGAEASAAAAKAKPTADGQTPPDDEALRLGAELAQAIEDPDFRSRVTLGLVEFQARRDVQKAAVLAETIPDYRQGVGLAVVAAAQGRAGKLDDLAAVIGRAIAPRELPHRWQTEAIIAEAAIAWTAGGRNEESESLVKSLTDEAARIRARSGIALERVRRGEKYDLDAFEFALADSKPRPERLQAARALLEIAQIKLDAAGTGADNLQAVASLCDQVQTVVAGSRAAAGEEYLDLGLLWRRLGHLEKSAAAVGQALRQMAPGIELHDWRDGYFAKLVSAYVNAGDRPAAERMLATARQNVPRLHEFYQPAALCQLAEAELAAGALAAAEQSWLKATQIARSNPNPSSQYLGCAQVALSTARANRPLPAEVKDLLAAQLSARTAVVEN